MLRKKLNLINLPGVVHPYRMASKLTQSRRLLVKLDFWLKTSVRMLWLTGGHFLCSPGSAQSLWLVYDIIVSECSRDSDSPLCHLQSRNCCGAAVPGPSHLCPVFGPVWADQPPCSDKHPLSHLFSPGRPLTMPATVQGTFHA